MLSIYLDQAKWIDLSRAQHGRADGDRFVQALESARQVVEMSLVRFPLSLGHYIETWRVGDPSRRGRLARTMIDLSRGQTMARPPDLCDNELDEFISRTTGVRPGRKIWPPLGRGFPHASGSSRELVGPDVDLELEFRQLANRPKGFLDFGDGHRQFADLYRDGEEGLAAGMAEDYPELQSESILAVSAVMEIHENIGWALKRAGMEADALGPIGLVRPEVPRENVRELLGDLLLAARGFIAELPTRDAALRLRCLRHQNPQARWEGNDLVDIAYLACAVVHCDVVVTEKQWVHELNRSGLLSEHNVVALSDVAELPDLLVTRVG